MTQFSFLLEPLRSGRLQARAMTAQELADARRLTWRTCPPVQDFFLEQHVARGAGFALRLDERDVGYVILTPERALVETRLRADAPIKPLIEEAIRLLRVSKIWRLDVEDELQGCFREIFPSARVLGLAFREYRPAPLPLAPFQPRPASDVDLQALLGILDPEIHPTPEALAEDLRHGRLFLYEQAQLLLGMGVVSRILPESPEHDIGLLVAPAFRGQGLGPAIVQHLAAHCLARGWTPVCGCDAGNHASRRCLEKAGFVQSHRLLELLPP